MSIVYDHGYFKLTLFKSKLYILDRIIFLIYISKKLYEVDNITTSIV